MCSSLSRQQWTARINRPQVETSHTPVFIVVPSPIAKVQATKKCICLVDHHNLFMVCPQENAHLCMVRVSKHLCLGVSTLTEIQKTNQFSLNKIKVCLKAFSMLNDLLAFWVTWLYMCQCQSINICVCVATHTAANFQINVTLHISLSQHQYQRLFACKHTRLPTFRLL
jgi:hypothetical protein